MMNIPVLGPGLGSMSPDNASSRKREMAIAQVFLFLLCIWLTLELVVEQRVHRFWRNIHAPLTDVNHVPGWGESQSYSDFKRVCSRL